MYFYLQTSQYKAGESEPSQVMSVWWKPVDGMHKEVGPEEDILQIGFTKAAVSRPEKNYSVSILKWQCEGAAWSQGLLVSAIIFYTSLSFYSHM